MKTAVIEVEKVIRFGKLKFFFSYEYSKTFFTAILKQITKR